jgi:hypothetical protein
MSQVLMLLPIKTGAVLKRHVRVGPEERFQAPLELLFPALTVE